MVKVLEGGLGRTAYMARGLAEVDEIRAAIESGPARLSGGDLVRRSSHASLGDRWQRTVWRRARAGRVLLRGALVVLRHCEVGGESCCGRCGLVSRRWKIERLGPGTAHSNTWCWDGRKDIS